MRSDLIIERDTEGFPVFISEKPQKGCFLEQYWAKINFKKPDGFWLISFHVDVKVRVQHGVNEKNNHEAAEKLVKAVFGDCEITCTTYC